MTHCFDVDIASRYGILEAILLNYFNFWIEKNKANDANYYDGHYWTYNSVSAFTKLFPYATKNKICNALNKLEKEGLIGTSNYNKSSYDRTKWYRLTDKGNAVLTAQTVEILDFLKSDNGESENQKWIAQNSEMDCSEMRNGLPENQKPIPVNNHLKDTVDYTVNNTNISAEFEALWKLYPKKQGKKKAFDCYQRARKQGATFEEVKTGVEAYVQYIKRRHIEEKFIKQGATFFSQQAWQDDWSINNGHSRFDEYDNGTDQGGDGEIEGWNAIFG